MTATTTTLSHKGIVRETEYFQAIDRGTVCFVQAQ